MFAVISRVFLNGINYKSKVFQSEKFIFYKMLYVKEGLDLTMEYDKPFHKGTIKLISFLNLGFPINIAMMGVVTTAII